MVKGLSKSSATQLIDARRSHPFSDIADLNQRTALAQRDLQCLARAGALNSMAKHRHNAHWQTAGIESRNHMLRSAPNTEAQLALVAPREAEEIAADYASLGLTLGRHPVALLRPKLQRLGSLTANDMRMHPGKYVRVTGLVTGRQRPGTASGAIFLTLEDETGNTNVVVWACLADHQRRELLESRLLTVHGIVECAGDVVHLIAKKLVDHSALLGALQLQSRDFH